MSEQYFLVRKLGLGKEVVSQTASWTGYLSANFGLPRPLCPRVISGVRDRQTDRQTLDARQMSDRQKSNSIIV